MAHNTWKGYCHLSQEEREELFGYVREGLSYREIWKRMSRSHSTISREINRNSTDLWWESTKYSPMKAQEKYQQRRYIANRAHVVLRRDHKQRTLLIDLLKEKWSYWWPDEIIWRLNDKGKQTISISTFYRFIREEMPELQRYLRHKATGYRTYKKWNKRKKTYTDLPNISQRSDEADNRERLGDREGDTVVSNRKVKWWLVTLVDRKSRYTLMKKIGNHKATTVKMTVEALLKWEKQKSLTIDNGVEFAKIHELKIAWYRANPYASYERWTNERTNGMIRWFIPKWANINERSDCHVQEIQDKLNHKPRKTLGYKTPYEVYHNTNLTYI